MIKFVSMYNYDLIIIIQLIGFVNVDFDYLVTSNLVNLVFLKVFLDSNNSKLLLSVEMKSKFLLLDD